MKRFFHIFIAGVLLSAVMLCFGCSAPNLPEKIDGELPSYSFSDSAAYGVLPDVDLTVDGDLSDEIWQDVEWTVQEMSGKNAEFTSKATGFMTEKGVCFAFTCDDASLFWQGRMQNTLNTNLYVNFRGSHVKGGKDITGRYDVYNVYPARHAINARVTYGGEVNVKGAGKGITLEAFVGWEQFGLKSAPESLTVSVTYTFKWTKVAPQENRSFNCVITTKK